MSRPAFEVDYDSESVWFEDSWFTREQLAARIKSMIEQGDYRLSRPSAALEALEGALGSARVVAARVSPQQAAALERLGEASGRPTSALVRDAVALFLEKHADEASAKASTQAHVALDEDPEVEKSLFGA